MGGGVGFGRRSLLNRNLLRFANPMRPRFLAGNHGKTSVVKNNSSECVSM
jgi:hypothetical protein